MCYASVHWLLFTCARAHTHAHTCYGLEVNFFRAGSKELFLSQKHKNLVRLRYSHLVETNIYKSFQVDDVKRKISEVGVSVFGGMIKLESLSFGSFVHPKNIKTIMIF